MADHEDHQKKEETFMEKLTEKFHGHQEKSKSSSSSSSSSDSEDEKKKSKTESSVKEKFSNRLFGREQPVHKLVGGGKVADVFLWRDKKISAGVLGGATAIWLLFDVLEYHLLTFICHALIIILALLFLWSNASFFINKSQPRIPEVHIPEKPLVQFASELRTEINRALATLRDIALGRDLKKFLGVIAGLWVLSVLGNCCSFFTLFYTTFLLLLSVPVFYEKYEDQVDAFAHKATVELKKQYAVFDAKVLSKIPRGPLKQKRV